MSEAGSLVRALFSRRWVAVTIGVVVLMGVLARLGIWQLDRLQERRAANAALVAALDSPPIDVNAEIDRLVGLNDDAALEGLRDHDVLARGRFDLDHPFILKVQTYQNQPGVNLVTPLLLEGAGGAAVLVDRGWVPDEALESGELSAYDLENPAAVRGYVALSQTLRRTADNAGSIQGNQVYRVDVAAIEERLPYPLLPFYIRSAPPEGGDTTAPFRVPREVDLSEGPHLGYAAQWFIFSLGLGIGYVVFVRRKEMSQPESAQSLPTG